MRIEVNVIDKGNIVDSYRYSIDNFFHNERELIVTDKEVKLIHLISMTFKWENSYIISNQGFYIGVEIDNYFKEYRFNNKVPNNFNAFIYEVKNMEEK